MKIRPMEEGEWEAVAKLIHRSTNAWYERNLRRKIFTGGWRDCRVFAEVYEALDPGCCLVAEAGRGKIAGSCFYHPRETHVSLGIMNVNPDFAGEGVARKLLHEVILKAGDRPVRLVSSAMNLDSFSLYTRAGFAPYEVFQDMWFPDGMERGGEGVPGGSVRDAVRGDVADIVALEEELLGISRRRDIEMFIRNTLGIWSCSVSIDEEGQVNGYLASIDHPGSRMLGPGVATDAEVSLALIVAEMGRERGGSPVFLVPAKRWRLVSKLYRLGARNCELHLGQARGSVSRPKGVMMPTFMPESA
jgi:GNAT superfamily N-acetyltransferase